MQQIVLAPAEKRLPVGSSSREGPFLPLHNSHTEQVPPKYQQCTLLLSQLRHFLPRHLLKGKVFNSGVLGSIILYHRTQIETI